MSKIKEFNLWGIKYEPGKIFYPCNGTEEDAFINHFCRRCNNFGEGECNIMLSTFFHPPLDPEYPKEWIYNENGNPTCTSIDQKDKL